MSKTLLETTRLLLREPGSDDAALVLEYVALNREHLASWEPTRSESYFTLAHWVEQLGRNQEQIQSGTMAQFLLVEKATPGSALVGQCALTNIVRGPFQAAYLGYSLAATSTGKGLMEEALGAVISYGFELLHLHRIMANYMPRNERSGKLLRRLGFSVEGYARDYLRIGERWEDHILTALTNARWEAASD